MNRAVNSLDNTYAESFIKTLKSKEVHLWEYPTKAEVQRRIFYFIDDLYNYKWLHHAISKCPHYEFDIVLESISNSRQATLITMP